MPRVIWIGLAAIGEQAGACCLVTAFDAAFERFSEGEQEEGQDPERTHRHRDAVERHHADEHGEGDDEVDRSREHGGDRNGEPREVDLGDELLTRDDAVRRLGEPIGEERPGYQGGEAEERVGDAVGRHTGEATEEQAEHDHAHERLDDGPEEPEHGLLVPNSHVPPGEEVQQLAEGPELSEPERAPACRRLDHRHDVAPRARRAVRGCAGVLRDGRRPRRSAGGHGSGRDAAVPVRGCGRAVVQLTSEDGAREAAPDVFRQSCIQNPKAAPRTRPSFSLYSSVPSDQPLENEMTITIEYCTV